MKTERLLTLALLVVLGFVAVSSLWGPSSSAQLPTAAAPTMGRFQMALKTGDSVVFVLDTQSGQCWYKDSSPEVKGWTSMGSPVIKER